MAVLDNGLTINDCRLAAEVGSGTDDRWITVAPIISVAGEDTGFPSLNQHLGAIAIVFDFVNPVLALWRLIDQRRKLWLDKPEPCRKHYFVLFGSLTEEAPDGGCQGFFRSFEMERRDDGRVTITTGPNYHLAWINQPLGKPISLPLDAMASCLKRSPGEAAANRGF